MFIETMKLCYLTVGDAVEVELVSEEVVSGVIRAVRDIDISSTDEKEWDVFIGRRGVNFSEVKRLVSAAGGVPASPDDTLVPVVYTARSNELSFASADSLDEIRWGDLNFDVVIASPDAMRVVGTLGSVLGPRGLMPNPK